MAATTGVDVLVIGFNALSCEEQEQVAARINDIRASRDAAGESMMARCIRSLRRVQAEVGHVPTVTEYKAEAPGLIAAGEDIENFTRLYAHFDQNWRRAKEALELSEANTALKIDKRFRERKIGKKWRFTEHEMREALTECVAFLKGQVPLVADYKNWRWRKLELAEAAGDSYLQVPSDSPFRRRYGSWEAAMLHFGYTPDEVAERLSRK